MSKQLEPYDGWEEVFKDWKAMVQRNSAHQLTCPVIAVPNVATVHTPDPPVLSTPTSGSQCKQLKPNVVSRSALRILQERVVTCHDVPALPTADWKLWH